MQNKAQTIKNAPWWVIFYVVGSMGTLRVSTNKTLKGFSFES